jgi:hypothetical protein
MIGAGHQRHEHSHRISAHCGPDSIGKGRRKVNISSHNRFDGQIRSHNDKIDF